MVSPFSPRQDRPSSSSARQDRPSSSSAGAEARGQMSWWRRGSHAGHGPHPKEERVQLNCFWFEGSEDAVLPSKTSTAVLELATAVLESSSINVGWTLVQMQPHFWFYQTMGCTQCIAFHLQPTRRYFVVPVSCLFGQGMPEKWDQSVPQHVCSGVRQKISSAAWTASCSSCSSCSGLSSLFCSFSMLRTFLVLGVDNLAALA